MRYLEYKGFNRSLHELYQKGGKYKTAANKVSTILENIGMVEDPLEGMRLTNHGESRIKHCIKYRLNDSCRLITIRHQGCCFLLFAASHDDADEWLDRNRGLSPVFRGNGGFAGTYVSEGMDEGERITGPAGHTNGKLCKLLPRDLFDLLVAEGVTGFLLQIALGLVYRVGLWTAQGATVGQKAVGVEITTVDGEPLDLGRALLRYVGYIASGITLGIGFLIIVFTGQKRGLHDYIAGTVVVKTR